MRNLVRATLFTLLVAGAAASLHAQDIRSRSDGPSRRGFWLGLGLGGGKYDNDCDICAPGVAPTSAAAGHLKLGGTLSQHLRLGTDIFSMATSSGQYGKLSGSGASADEAVADVTLSLWYYPRARGNLWLQGGIGGVAYMAHLQGGQRESASSAGGVLALGYDLRMGRNGSVTPYLRWVGSGESNLKDASGADVGPARWRTSYWAFGVDYVFH